MTLQVNIPELIAATDGVLRLEPAFVARTSAPAGRRLNLPDEDYDQGERGEFSERWLASTTKADNPIGPDDEGLSYLVAADGGRELLRDAVAAHPELILGADYAAEHDGLGRLAKIFDYLARIPYHIHPPQEQADKVGLTSKDEAYYFPPGVDLGAHPETFIGVHPYLGDTATPEIFLPYLKAWNDNLILKHSVAYQQVADEGFYVASGMLHAPGTALTIELQEDSDTLAMFQALNAGSILSKELLFKDVSAEERETLGEAALLQWVDWEANASPHFYRDNVIIPKPYFEAEGVDASWIFTGSMKFSGKRIRLAPGARMRSTERGVHNILVWSGTGTIAGVPVTGGDPWSDELLLVHDRAVSEHEIVNTGDTEMIVVKFFGPGINPDAPGAGVA